MAGIQVLTVSQLNRYVKTKLEEDPLLHGIFIKGEISNFTRHRLSGHCYFTLKDEKAAVKCVMFASQARSLRFEPENGLAVVAAGNISLYERDGAYQVYVTDLIPEGLGSLQLAFQQLYARLERQGYFDAACKKPLPRYPQVIGVVMSEHSAAFQDVCNIVSRRYPAVKILLHHSSVQGQDAPAQLAAGVRALDTRCDVIIIGRGGGSYEDLWCFNSEELARVIFSAKTPVVSAVGHETDFTICDFVSDCRAPTPSAAAELVTPQLEHLLSMLQGYRETMFAREVRYLNEQSQRLDDAFVRVRRSALGKITANTQALYSCRDRIQRTFRALLQKKQYQLAGAAARLEAASPLRRMAAGYARVQKDGQGIRSVGQLSPDDEILIRLADGDASARIVAIEERWKGNAKEKAEL